MKTKVLTKKQCMDLLKKNKTPLNVIEHCKAVCKVAENVTNRLIMKNITVNKELVIASAMLHDIERMKQNHVVKGGNLLKKLGYKDVSRVIKKHGLYMLFEKRNMPLTIEEKIVFYADKKVKENKIVSLKKRFLDLEKRYNVDLKKELNFTLNIEKELLSRLSRK